MGLKQLERKPIGRVKRKKEDEALEEILARKETQIKVVGAGGAGNNTVTRLMQVGIVGFMFFAYFWIKYFFIIFAARKNLSYNNPLKSSILVLAIGFWGMLISHFTFIQFFGYYIHTDRIVFTIFLILFSEFFIKESLEIERSKKNLTSNNKNH